MNLHNPNEFTAIFNTIDAPDEPSTWLTEEVEAIRNQIDRDEWNDANGRQPGTWLCTRDGKIERVA